MKRTSILCALALAGHGSGVNLGVSFGKFTISPK